MARPQIVVTVAEAPPAAVAGALTSTTFLGFAATTGPQEAVRVSTSKEARAAGASEAVAQIVNDLVSENRGTGSVVLVRIPVAPAQLADADEELIRDALAAASTTDHGVGQVIVPGVTAPNVHSAMLDHVAATGRTTYLDLDDTATAAELIDYVTTLRERAGAERAGAFVGNLRVPTVGGAERTVAASVLAAGATARMDARVGHANRMVAGVQEFGDAGLSYLGTGGSSVAFTDTELDNLSDAGINPIINRPVGALIYDWLSISSDPDWRQLNYGRMAMQIASAAGAFLEQYLFRPLDGKGHLLAECEAGLEGSVFLPLYNADAVFGATPADAYTVQVSAVTTPAEIAAGTLHAACSTAFTPGARRVQFDVTIRPAGVVA